jgi:hypothetical protein
MTTINTFHAELAGDLLGWSLRDEDALAVMILFHTHRIHLKTAILEDRPGILEVAAITQRHAAQSVASAWCDRSDDRRRSYEYWYFRYNSETPYEVMSDIPSNWQSQIEELKTQLTGHPAVKKVEPED